VRQRQTAKEGVLVDYDGKFYLGRPYDLKKGKTGTKPLLYDPHCFTTQMI